MKPRRVYTAKLPGATRGFRPVDSTLGEPSAGQGRFVASFGRIDNLSPAISRGLEGDLHPIPASASDDPSRGTREWMTTPWTTTARTAGAAAS